MKRSIGIMLLVFAVAALSAPAAYRTITRYLEVNGRDSAGYVAKITNSATNGKGLLVSGSLKASGYSVNVRAGSGIINATATDDFINVDTSGGNGAVFLPSAAANCGKVISVHASGAGIVNVTHTGSDTVAGGSSTTVNGNGSGQFVSDCVADWVQVGGW